MPAWLTSEGGFHEKSSITSRDGQITVRGETLADVEAARREYEATLQARANRCPRGDEPIVTPDATPALIIEPRHGQPSLTRRLDRLACKIALGFIAARAGADVALDPRLIPFVPAR